MSETEQPPSSEAMMIGSTRMEADDAAEERKHF
jgi:hypothetical protein